MVRTVRMRLGPMSLVMAAGRPSSNLRFMRMGLRRPPVARRLWCEEREIPLRRTEKADRNKRVCVCVCEREREREEDKPKWGKGKKGRRGEDRRRFLHICFRLCSFVSLQTCHVLFPCTLTHSHTDRHTNTRAALTHRQTHTPSSSLTHHPFPLPCIHLHSHGWSFPRRNKGGGENTRKGKKAQGGEPAEEHPGSPQLTKNWQRCREQSPNLAPRARDNRWRPKNLPRSNKAQNGAHDPFALLFRFKCTPHPI